MLVYQYHPCTIQGPSTGMGHEVKSQGGDRGRSVPLRYRRFSVHRSESVTVPAPVNTEARAVPATSAISKPDAAARPTVRASSQSCPHALYRRGRRRLQRGSAEGHAATIKHTVMMAEKTMKVMKACLQFKALTAAKQMGAPKQCGAFVRKSLPEGSLSVPPVMEAAVAVCFASAHDERQ